MGAQIVAKMRSSLILAVLLVVALAQVVPRQVVSDESLRALAKKWTAESKDSRSVVDRLRKSEVVSAAGELLRERRRRRMERRRRRKEERKARKGKPRQERRRIRKEQRKARKEQRKARKEQRKARKVEKKKETEAEKKRRRKRIVTTLEAEQEEQIREGLTNDELRELDRKARNSASLAGPMWAVVALVATLLVAM